MYTNTHNHSQMMGFLINDKQNAFYALSRCMSVLMVWNRTVHRHPIPIHTCYVCVCVCSVNSIIIANYFQLIFLQHSKEWKRERGVSEDFSIDAGRHSIMDESSFVGNRVCCYVVEIVLFSFIFLVLFVLFHFVATFSDKVYAMHFAKWTTTKKKHRRRSKGRWRKVFRGTKLILEIIFILLYLELKPITVDNHFVQ